MLSQTTQNRLFQKAARSVLTAKRQDQGYTATITVAPDMPLEFRSLGKDLVAQMTGAVAADKTVDGRYVDLVGPSGERIKVFSRVVRKQLRGYQSHLCGGELSCINYADPKDSPDTIYLVVYNPITNNVDVFSFSVEDPDTKNFGLSLGVFYSLRTNSYGCKEAYKQATFSV